MPLRKKRDLVLWWTGSTVSSLGTGIASIAFPLLVLGATGSAAKMAIVGVGSYVAMIALALPAGVLADRYSRRRILVLVPLVDAVAVGTVTVAVLAGRVSIVHLALVGFVLAVTGALYGGASNPTLRRIVPTEQIEYALSRGMAIANTVGLVGPPIGGLLYSVAPWLPFAVDTVSFAAAAVAAALIRTPLGPEARGEPSARGWLWREMRDGLRYVGASGFLRFDAIWCCLIGAALSAAPLAQIVLLRDRGADGFTVGLAFGLASAGGLLGALATPWLMRRFPSRRLVVMATWELEAGVAANAFLPHPLAIGLAMGSAMFLFSPLVVIINGFELRLVPDAYQARVSKILGISELSLSWFAAVAAGALIDAAGAATAALATAGLFAVVAIISQLARSLHQLDADEPSLA